MSLLKAIKVEQCTRCFGCCYTALPKGYELEEEEDDDLPIPWFEIPIFDGSTEFFAICHYACIDDGKPYCFIYNERSQFCKDYFCWDDEDFRGMRRKK